MTVSFTNLANQLTEGTQTETVSFTEQANGRGNTARSVQLRVQEAPGVLQVLGNNGLDSSGFAGSNSFSPNAITYTLTNIGGEPLGLVGRAGALAPLGWDLSSTGGSLLPNGSVEVVVALTDAANFLTAETYTETVHFADQTAGTSTARSVQLRIDTPQIGFLLVTPTTGITAAGPVGGPFTAATQTYTLRNTGNSALDWSAVGSANWLSLSSISGRLEPGTETTVFVAFNSNASQLAAGSYTASISFANLTTGNGNTSRSVLLAANADPASLAVTGTGPFEATGPAGGAFNPATFLYTLTNVGGQGLNWTLTNSENWLTLSDISGRLEPGASSTVTVTINVNAEQNLLPGIFTDTLVFTNGTNGIGSTERNVTLEVRDPALGFLSIPRTDLLTSFGQVGGPFTPSSIRYTLTNTGGESLTWSTNHSQSWISLTNAGGVLEPGESTSVTIQLTSVANVQSVGYYTDTVNFVNLTSGYGTTARNALLTVSQEAQRLVVTPSAVYVAAGPQGGQILPATQDYVLTNAGGQPLAWSAVVNGGVTWVTLSATSGALLPGASVTVTAALSPAVNSLAVGTRSATLSFVNQDNGNGSTTRNVALEIQDASTPFMLVTDDGGLQAGGPLGGPFTTTKTWTVANVGGTAVNWRAIAPKNWYRLTSTGGVIEAGNSVEVTAYFNSNANLLATGLHTDTIIFENVNNHRGDTTRTVQLSIGEQVAELAVDEEEAFGSFGYYGGPFTPSSFIYTVRNVGNRELTWRIDGEPLWVSLSSDNGFLVPGATAQVVVQLNPRTELLAVGIHTATLSFVNISAGAGGAGNTTREIDLNVRAGDIPALTVTPVASLNSSGPLGGSFTPGGTVYTLRNAGTTPMEWTIDASENWITISSQRGTLQGGQSADVGITINSRANALPLGVHTARLLFRNLENTAGNTFRDVQLTISLEPQVLDVQGLTDTNVSGVVGGPFVPTTSTYTLTNLGGQAMIWATSANVSWLTLSATNGTLQPGESTAVEVIVNDIADHTLAAGTHTGTVTFTNSSNANGNTTRRVIVDVFDPAVGFLSIPKVSGLSAFGTVGGPFAPSSVEYILTNTGGETLGWSTTNNTTWVSLSHYAGTLEPGSAVTVTARLNTTANTLAQGVYTGTIGFQNTTTGNGTTSRTMMLTVSREPGSLEVSDAEPYSIRGPVGGPFTPAVKNYFLTNTGGQPIQWLMTNSVSWVSASATAGTLLPGATTTVTISTNLTTERRLAGTHNGILEFFNLTNSNGGTQRPVVLEVTDSEIGFMLVEDDQGFLSGGAVGGPFTPSTKAYTVRNIGGGRLIWRARKTTNANWLSITTTDGWLEPGAAATVEVQLNSYANQILLTGTYTDAIFFENTTNGKGNTNRGVVLSVGEGDGELAVAPFAAHEVIGPYGGPFSQSFSTFTLSNIGNRDLEWVITNKPSWVTLSSNLGQLIPGATVDVNIAINSNANIQTVGVHTAVMTFTNGFTGLGTQDYLMVLNVRADDHDFMAVTPDSSFGSTGSQGGPFTPATASYTITNTGGLPIAWSVTQTVNWFSVSTRLGALAAGQSTAVTVTLNSEAAKLAPGVYEGRVRFWNDTNGLRRHPSPSHPDGHRECRHPQRQRLGRLRRRGPQGRAVRADLRRLHADQHRWPGARLDGRQGARLDLADPVRYRWHAAARRQPVGPCQPQQHRRPDAQHRGGDRHRGLQQRDQPEWHHDPAPSPLTSRNPATSFLLVEGTDGLSSNGEVGGPFTPVIREYTLTNAGGKPLSWTASKTASWLSLTNNAGALEPGDSVTVTVIVNGEANRQVAGVYTDVLRFANLTDHTGGHVADHGADRQPGRRFLAGEPARRLREHRPGRWSVESGRDDLRADQYRRPAVELDRGQDQPLAVAVGDGWHAVAGDLGLGDRRGQPQCRLPGHGYPRRHALLRQQQQRRRQHHAPRGAGSAGRQRWLPGG